MNETDTVSSPHVYARGLDANRDSLLFLLDKLFHPQVMCAEPGGSCARIDDTIRFLKRNLTREERLMDLVRYPDAAAHKRDHQQVLRRLESMQRTLICGLYDNTQVAGFLDAWAERHAIDFDKPFGDFLYAHAPKPAQRDGRSGR